MQPSWVSLAQGLSQVAIRVSVGLQLSEGSSGRGSFANFTYMAVSRLTDKRTLVPYWLLVEASPSFLPYGPLLRAGYNIMADTSQSKRRRDQERPRKMEATIFFVT